jgi:hypothetical protein
MARYIEEPNLFVKKMGEALKDKSGYKSSLLSSACLFLEESFSCAILSMK